MVRVRLKVLLTRLTLYVLHAFIREWLAGASIRFQKWGGTGDQFIYTYMYVFYVCIYIWC